MAEPQQGSAPPHDLDDTRNDLAQASLALNTAYDRLRDLRTSLRNFSVQRDHLTRERSRLLGTETRSPVTMGPDHSAIVLSDSDEESEIDMEALRGSLPSRLLELTSRWSGQLTRLNAARQLLSPESSPNDNSSLAISPSEDRPAYSPPLRRRRPLPPAGASRDGGTTPPGPVSPARRSILETHLRQLAESNTPFARRMAQRSSVSVQGSAAGASESHIQSSIPLGIEPRPYSSTLESRAASHLRYSLLPNPPSAVRTTSASRIGPAGNTHPRYSERAEPRPRTVRSNSMTTLVAGRHSTSNSTHQNGTFDASVQTSSSARRSTAASTTLSEDDTGGISNTTSELGDAASGSYRVRRRINGQGEEHVFSINWSELMSEAERDDLSELATWMRSPPSPRMSRARTSRARSTQDAETDDTVVQEFLPFFIREGREGSVQRRRGWARLNADGDELSTEDEATLERSRTESQVPRFRVRSTVPWGDSTAAFLDFVQHGSRDRATRGDSHSSSARCVDTHQLDNNLHRIINSMFRSVNESATYNSPLPVPFPGKAGHGQQPEYVREVRVVLDGQMAGR